MLKILESKKIYVENFRKTYVKWNKQHPNQPLDIMDKELISYFVLKSYYDMMPRTFRKLKTKSKEIKIDHQKRDEVLHMLENEVLKYLESDDKDYSMWHKKCVEKFVNDFNLQVLDGKYKHIAFGKGQKIVNMTMKYLSTCDNSSDYEERFIDCHFTLDSYNLNWYYANVPNAKKVSCWSNLTYDKYKFIQDNIKKYFQKSGKNSFAEEWEIYEKAKKLM